MNLYFNTVNSFKAAEVKVFLEGSGLDLRIVGQAIQEILHIDLHVIVKDKALKAYEKVGVPCAVEHGGLQIRDLKMFPGGLSKVVWDTVGEKLVGFLSASDSREAVAKSVIGYCDGRRVHLFDGETKGMIAPSAKGDYRYQWDPIFIPEGDTRTYGEMGFPEKRKYSQAAKAWTKLVEHLKSVGH